MIDSEFACPRGRVQTKLDAARDGADSWNYRRGAGGDPAPVWRFIRGCGNEESIIRRHQVVPARPPRPMKNATRARMPSTNRIGWMMAPPAMAITSSTMPRINQSIWSLLVLIGVGACDTRVQ